MELNITAFFRGACPRDYFASIAEIGADAGRATWQAACDDSEDWPILDSDDKREAFRRFVRSSGGWTESEIRAWSDSELNALCLQWIAGDMREGGIGPDSTPEDWAEYETRAESGQCSGSIYRGDSGAVYWYCEG